MAQPDFGVVNLSDLSTEEQAAFARARSQIGYYAHTARQINRILSLDGVTPLFLLQPALLLSHKPLTEREQRMYSAHRRRTGRASVYTYAQLYPLIADSMRQAATEDGFTFEDLTGVFDQTREQTFTDYCHLTPAANQMIAERIVSIMHNFFEKNARGASHTGGY